MDQFANALQPAFPKFELVGLAREGDITGHDDAINLFNQRSAYRSQIALKFVPDIVVGIVNVSSLPAAEMDVGQMQENSVRVKLWLFHHW